MTSRLALALALVLGVVVGGCKAKPAEGEADSSAAAERVVVAAPLHSQDLGLDTPGAEPRERLRYAGSAPARSISLATFTERGREGMGEQPFVDVRLGWAGTPRAGAGLAMTWSVDDLRGELVGEFGREPRLAGGPAQKFGATLESMFEDVAGRAEGGARGRLRVIQNQGLQTTPSVPVQLDLFVVPLPAEAIGVGASWSATASYPLEIPSWRKREPSDELSFAALVSDYEPHSEGVEVTQVERYTLVARDGPELRIAYELETEASGGEGFNPSSAEGELIVRLDDPLARAGTIEHHTRISLPAVEGVEATAHHSRQRFVLRTLDGS